MKNLSVTDIELYFLIFFLLTVTAVTVKSVTRRQFYHLPSFKASLCSVAPRLGITVLVCCCNKQSLNLTFPIYFPYIPFCYPHGSFFVTLFLSVLVHLSFGGQDHFACQRLQEQSDLFDFKWKLSFTCRKFSGTLLGDFILIQLIFNSLCLPEGQTVGMGKLGKGSQ